MISLQDSDYRASKKGPATVCAIGTFDGVHLGHQSVLRTLVEAAGSRMLRAVVITFDRHPLAQIRPEAVPPMLCSPDEKLRLLYSCGVDEVIVLPFDRAIADMSAEDFLGFLIDRWSCSHLVMGHNNALGRGRIGTPEHMSVIAALAGIGFSVVGPVYALDSLVSSTEIRQRLVDGDVSGAAVMLGRYYSVTSLVIKGDGRGRNLGFATANLELPRHQFLPKDGVYATRAQVLGKAFASITNFGIRPTFHSSPSRSLEVHLLNTPGDIYDIELTLEFVAYLRAERRFNSGEELIDQINRDIVAATSILQECGDSRR